MRNFNACDMMNQGETIEIRFQFTTQNFTKCHNGKFCNSDEVIQCGFSGDFFHKDEEKIEFIKEDGTHSIALANKGFFNHRDIVDLGEDHYLRYAHVDYFVKNKNKKEKTYSFKKALKLMRTNGMFFQAINNDRGCFYIENEVLLFLAIDGEKIRPSSSYNYMNSQRYKAVKVKI